MGGLRLLMISMEDLDLDMVLDIDLDPRFLKMKITPMPPDRLKAVWQYPLTVVELKPPHPRLRPCSIAERLGPVSSGGLPPVQRWPLRDQQRPQPRIVWMDQKRRVLGGPDLYARASPPPPRREAGHRLMVRA